MTNYKISESDKGSSIADGLAKNDGSLFDALKMEMGEELIDDYDKWKNGIILANGTYNGAPSDYYVSDPIRLFAGETIEVTGKQYGDSLIIALTDESGSYYKAGILGGGENHKASSNASYTYSYTATEECYVAVSAMRNDATGSIKVNHFHSIRLDDHDAFIAANFPKRYSPCHSFGTQPGADGSDSTFNFNAENMTYDDLITNIYEPLRTAHTNYITRTELGKDASGTYTMYAYEFTPKYYQQHILLYAGAHGDEPDGVLCLARIMQLITNSDGSDADLEYLRFNVKITCIPCCNVWGFSQHPNQRENSAGVDGQTWGLSNQSVEVTNIRSYLDSKVSDVSFGLSMHTTTNNGYKDFYGVIPRGKNIRTIYRTNNWLCEHYAKDGATVDDQYLGYLNYAGLEVNYWASTYKIPAACMELSDFRWDTKKSTSSALTMGVTMWLNYIIQQVNDCYKNAGLDIPDEDYRESKA